MEVVLGAILFSVVILGLALVSYYHEMSLRQYRDRNAARLLLQQEMERVMAHHYPNLEEAAGLKTIPFRRELDGVVSEQDFEIETEVTENPNRIEKTVVSTVRYQANNETLEITARCLLYATH